MWRTGWIALVMAVSVVSMDAAAAAPPADSTVEARLRALEKRVSDIEQKETDRERRAASAPVAPAPAAVPAAAPPAPAVAAPQRWQKASNWAELRVGMTWSQVKALLGVPGKVKAGVFGDVMYFPDTDGGSVEFDRDGRVSRWSESPAHD